MAYEKLKSEKSTPESLYGVEITKRPPKTWAQVVHGILFFVAFNLGCIMTHAVQIFFLLPLKLVPGVWAHTQYESGIRYTKGAFGVLCTLMCQLFGPTKMRITFETEGEGAFTREEIEQIVVRDASGRVVELRLPNRLVIIANHQIYADWWYLWVLTYYMNMHKDVLIVLKKSLKWLPIVGWGMQVYRFIFLARSWASDRLYLISQLAKLGRMAEQENTPFAFILYPEGTLVSSETRPISKKFADKMGIPDMKHTLLPRSTGLHHALRALSPKVPSLKLLDITVAYPGIPPVAYGQSYYTLRSIFMDRVPPPVIHLHLRLFDVASAVPVGDLTATSATQLPPRANGHADPQSVEADVPETEREKFDLWLRELWRAKDSKIDEYLERGSFESGAGAVEIPLVLKTPSDALDAYCYFGPALLGYIWKRLRG